MKTSDFDYDLPEELIAQDPLLDRSSSRLMHLDRVTGELKHDCFKNVASYLQPGDTLVINDTKVIPARLLGVKAETGAGIELLLLKRLSDCEWETLAKPGRKCKEGTVIHFGTPDEDGIYPLSAEVTGILEEGNRKIRFIYDG
ncbi:MAG: S-adenosylmethionine:tRNA ribosyltransferase-isomerase, partial [Lachnospiraceae bacterium]|nr:S-adenosylmethionine:tRNA ribosyltransferase-isomerase [Lachnospiraceae bacterium]